MHRKTWLGSATLSGGLHLLLFGGLLVSGGVTPPRYGLEGRPPGAEVTWVPPELPVDPPVEESDERPKTVPPRIEIEEPAFLDPAPGAIGTGAAPRIAPEEAPPPPAPEIPIPPILRSHRRLAAAVERARSAPANAQPDYPRRAQRMGWEGAGRLRVRIDASGIPTGVDCIESSGHVSLDEAAMKTVLGWRFLPARNALGHPVPDEIEIPFRFSLTDGPAVR